MIVELFPIKDLTLMKDNPRTITKEQFEKLCNSIAADPEFLNARPVLVNHTQSHPPGSIREIYTVYAGNQRVRAAKKLGYETIPCIVEEDLPEEILKKRMILDNKTFGLFDFDLLANEWDIDVLKFCGFDESEIFADFDREPDKKSKKEKNCPNCGFKI